MGMDAKEVSNDLVKLTSEIERLEARAFSSTEEGNPEEAVLYQHEVEELKRLHFLLSRGNYREAAEYFYGLPSTTKYFVPSRLFDNLFDEFRTFNSKENSVKEAKKKAWGDASGNREIRDSSTLQRIELAHWEKSVANRGPEALDFIITNLEELGLRMLKSGEGEIDKVISLLDKLVSDKDTAVSQGAQKSLGVIKALKQGSNSDETVVTESLKTIIAGFNNSIARGADIGIAMQEASLDEVMGMAKDPDILIRSHVVWELANRPLAKALDVLISMVNDKSERVSAHAVEALVGLNLKAGDKREAFIKALWVNPLREIGALKALRSMGEEVTQKTLKAHGLGYANETTIVESDVSKYLEQFNK